MSTSASVQPYPCDKGVPNGSVSGWHNFQGTYSNGMFISVCTYCGAKR